MKLYIKNMVCDRCKMVVTQRLTELGHYLMKVALGEVDIAATTLPPEAISTIENALRPLGFDLITDRKSQTVEAIKTAVIALIHHKNDETRLKHSEYLSQQTGMDYPHLTKLFSDAEGITIEQYIIRQKIERVKELLAYGELTLSEIAWQLGYSSVAALSTQFKKVVGVTPTAFKDAGGEGRKTLDKVGK